jgi:hypothetical protein
MKYRSGLLDRSSDDRDAGPGISGRHGELEPAWIKEAFEERQPGKYASTPQFERLRSDRRFADLVRRIKRVGRSTGEA